MSPAGTSRDTERLLTPGVAVSDLAGCLVRRRVWDRTGCDASWPTESSPDDVSLCLFLPRDRGPSKNGWFSTKSKRARSRSE